MKLFVFCLVGLVAISMVATSPTPHSRGCIYILGKCSSECPEGTHAYTTGCGPKTPEPTCDEPNPVKEKYPICDYSSCYCDSPTVRDSVSKKCVKLEECPKKAENEKKEEKEEKKEKEDKKEKEEKKGKE